MRRLEVNKSQWITPKQHPFNLTIFLFPMKQPINVKTYILIPTSHQQKYARHIN